MMWMGKVSAWGAVAMGLVFAALAALHLSWGLTNWVAALVAALLLAGGFRTLRKMSGGLRLLAGAWGVAAGLMLTPYLSVRDVAPNPSIYAADIGPMLGLVIAAIPLIALAGLTLTVLHKER